ncbi:unnamed protein product [Durusdinium trenchii]|uniref:Uncharacterized protein n=1 Tax=Durusdinium trenchii TaxID=1381693 RepID=A0ABP0N4Y3_9DINO
MAAEHGGPPFETALHEAHQRLLAAHGAALATLEAELQHMRMENMRLRLRLAQAGLSDAEPVRKEVASEAPAVSSVGSVRSELVEAAPVATGGAPAVVSAATEAPRATRAEPAMVEPSTLTGAPPPAPHRAEVPPLPSAREVPPKESRTHLGDLEKPLYSGTDAGSALGSTGPSPTSPGGSGAVVRVLLTELLQRYGLQHLPVSQAGSTYTLGGQPFRLRQAGTDLLASHDGGHSWELLEALLVQHLPQLQASAGRSERLAPQTTAHLGDQVPTVHLSGTAQAATASAPTGPIVWEGPEAFGAGARPGEGGLPAWRADGLPTFHNAFPQSFDALSGARQYYSQFRVRVPTASQYDSER